MATSIPAAASPGATDAKAAAAPPQPSSSTASPPGPRVGKFIGPLHPRRCAGCKQLFKTHGWYKKHIGHMNCAHVRGAAATTSYVDASARDKQAGASPTNQFTTAPVAPSEEVSLLGYIISQ